MKVILFLIILFASALRTSLHAQDVTIKNLSIAQGLSQSTVNDILQDKYGYVWISTGDGLDRYDGHTFRHFRYEPGSSYSLPSNSVRGLWEDTLRSRIWIGTDNGICFYDQQKGYVREPLLSDADFKNAYCVPLKTDDQFLWCCVGNKGIARIRLSSLETEWIERFMLHDLLVTLPNTMEVFYRQHSKYLFRLNLLSGHKDSIAWPTTGLTSIAANMKWLSEDVFEIYSSEGAFRADFGRDEISPIVLSNPFTPGDVVVDVCTDAKGYRFVAVAGNGIYVLNPEGKLHRRFSGSYESSQKVFFDVKNVRHFMIDNNKVMWCATDGSGIVMIDLKAEKFTEVQGTSPEGTIEEVHSFSRGIAEMDEQLWIGTYQEGLYICDRKSGGLNHILQDDSRLRGISDMVDCGSYVLLGCESGLFKLNKPYISAHLQVVDATIQVKDLCMVGDVCRVATRMGLYEYSIYSGQLKHSDVVQNMNTTFIFQDNSGCIFIGLNNEGIVKVLPDGTLRPIVLMTDPMPNLQMLCMVNYKDGYYAAGNHGLFQFDKELHVKAHFNELNGISNAYIYGILVDRNGMLWLSTNNGVSMFNPETEQFRNFSLADGLQSLEHNRGSYLVDSNGLFYFGGTTGVSQFIPEALDIPEHLPIIRLSSLRVNNQPASNIDSLVFATEGISFGYDRNSFEFELAVLEFFNPEKFVIECMLEGWDSEFQQCGGDYIIRYTNIPPGDYHLLCRIAHEVNAPINRLLSFSIDAPFWRRWWFIALAGMLGLAVLFVINVSIIRTRSKRALATLERVREIEKMRTRISKDIHDEVGAGLTKIALMSEVAKLNSTSKEELTNTLDKLADASRTITKGLHEIIWSVNPDEDNSTSMFDRVNQYAHDFLEDVDIELHVQIQETTNLSITPVMRRNVFLIVKEALNNSVKHAKATRVDISLRTEIDNTWEMVISDNGVGFSTDNTSTGHGLRNMKMRAEQCGLDLKVDSEEGKGTTIRLIGKSE